MAVSHIDAAVVALSLSPSPSLLLFLSLTVTRHLSRDFSWMEICSSSLQTGRLCERMQSLGDGLSGSVYWHALIWHWVKGMSHRLQTHYHITATPANREAAPRVQVELHQCSLIQLPQATRSNKPCLHCVLAGWRGDGASKGHVCRCSDSQHTHTDTQKCTYYCHTHTNMYSRLQLTKNPPALLTHNPLNTISVYTSC